jgi:hypothetical protein
MSGSPVISKKTRREVDRGEGEVFLQWILEHGHGGVAVTAAKLGPGNKPQHALDAQR